MRTRYYAEIGALPREHRLRLHDLSDAVEATREAARIAMLAYVRAEMDARAVSAEERADLERLFNGVPGDDRQMSHYGADTRHGVRWEIYRNHDFVCHPETRGRIVGEAA